MKDIQAKVRRIIELKPEDSCDVYDHLCFEFESLAKEIHDDALKLATDHLRKAAKTYPPDYARALEHHADYLDTCKTVACVAMVNSKGI
jgi:hypothetical protein